MEQNIQEKLLNDFAHSKKDVGSAEIQIISLTFEIKYLTEHIKINKKDVHSRRGLIAKVSKRRKLLKYLHINDNDIYINLCKKLNLRYK